MLGHAEQSDLAGLDFSLCVGVEYQEPQLPVVTDPVADSAVSHSAAESSAFVKKPETFGPALHHPCRHPCPRPRRRRAGVGPWYTATRRPALLRGSRGAPVMGPETLTGLGGTVGRGAEVAVAGPTGSPR